MSDNKPKLWTVRYFSESFGEWIAKESVIEALDEDSAVRQIATSHPERTYIAKPQQVSGYNPA